MGQTIVEKISQSHMAEGPDRPLRTGDFLSIRPDHVMTHDNTSAVMKKFKGIGAMKIHDPADRNDVRERSWSGCRRAAICTLTLAAPPTPRC